MLIESNELKTRIEEISNKVLSATNDKVRIAEYIYLPYYGNIILRFQIINENYTIDDVDKYETIINEIVGDEFLIDFMGTVYKKIGVDYSRLEDIINSFKSVYANEEIVHSRYYDVLNSDAREILEKCGFDTNIEVWEIQYEDEINIFILGKERKELKIVELEKKYNFYEIDKSNCEALIKATFFAKRNNSSLGRLMLEAK